MSLGTVSGSVRLNTRQAVAAYAALRAQNARTVYAMRGTGDAFVGTGKVMAATGAGMVAVFAKAVSAAAEFERKMDFFAAVTDTNAASMQKLSKYTLKVAQDTIYSADQIADGFIELGKAGVNAEQVMGGVGRAMANLGQAADIPLAEAGQIITSTIQQFDLKARQATKVTDLLAGAANASIADVTDLGVSLKYVGGVANVSGLKLEDTMTAISLLAKAGIRGSTAGTSLRQMIVSLPGATKPAYKAMKELGIITKDGKNEFYDMHGNLKPLSKIFQILQNDLRGMTAEQKVVYLRTLFNNRAVSAAALLTREGAKGFREMNKEMKKTTAADVSAKRLDNLSGDIEILKGNLETLLITQGSPFQEQLRKWTQDLTKLVQAFSKLDPQMQKNIFQFLGIGGATLIAMGAISIIIGTVFRFLVAMKRMGAGVMFVARVLGLYAPAAEGAAAATGLLAGPVGWIVLALVALVIGLIIAYKKLDWFHKFVDYAAGQFVKGAKQIIDGAKAAWQWVVKFAKGAGEKIVQFKDWTVNAFKSVVAWFKRLIDRVRAIPSQIGSAFSRATSAVGKFVGGVVDWFQKLPGRILAQLQKIGQWVQNTFTFHNIGYALGFALGTVIRWGLQLGNKLRQLVSSAVTSVVNFFQALPAKIGHALVTAAVWVDTKMDHIRQTMARLALRAVNAVVTWFQKLPGRVANILARVAAWVTTKFNAIKDFVTQTIPKIFHAVVDWFEKLPGRIWRALVRMLQKIHDIEARVWNAAVKLGKNLFNGAIEFAKDLPGKIRGILDDVIGGIKDKIADVYNKMKDFGSGLWEGFKDGVGMHSPSHIERAMWQITDTVNKEANRLAQQTLDVQKLSKSMADTQFGVGSVATGQMSVASMMKGQAVADRIAARTGNTSITNTRGTTINKTYNNKFDINNPKAERGSESVTKALKQKVSEAGYND